MLFGHPGHITTPPDSPKGECWPKESQQEVVGSVLALELGGEERLRSPSTTPPRLDRLRLSCSRHMAMAEILALQPRGFCNLPADQMGLCMSSLQKFKPAFFCLQRRGEGTAGHLPSIENHSEVIPWWVPPPPSSK